MKILELTKEHAFYKAWAEDAYEILKDPNMHFKSAKYDTEAEGLVTQWESFHKGDLKND